LTGNNARGFNHDVLEGESPAVPSVVRFTAPHAVDVVNYEREPLPPGHVRVRTRFSGISAGTELTAYRGSNPYLTKHWDPERRLFTTGGQSFSYPVSGWGYSEVGDVVEVSDSTEPADPDVPRRPDERRGGHDDHGVAVGDIVYGIWGHRSEAVLPITAVLGRRLPNQLDPITGVFARVGAIALNAVLAANVHVGETVAIFGQGVIGLLATRLAVLSGATVVAIDTNPTRLEMAGRFGAKHLLDASDSVAEHVRTLTGDLGDDVAIELSGAYPALHEAIRTSAVDGRVVAAGFYQGQGASLSLGEEFHHNRISIVASQIGGLPVGLAERWTSERLHRTVMALIADGRLEVAPLVSRIVPAQQAASAYELLDRHPGSTLQVVLDFRDPAISESSRQ
jgi:2-desacetyl-2-hydroxyethyl bacteriochlorophyllide A dehydrogenase